MATAFHKVTGKAQWAKLYERNRDTKSPHPGVQKSLDATNGRTSIELVLDPDQLEVFEASGSQKQVRAGENGAIVKFERPWEHRIEDFGGAPDVFDKDGNEWDENQLIGNDSTVEVTFVTYDTEMGKGTRLEKVVVLDLVKYESPVKEELPF